MSRAGVLAVCLALWLAALPADAASPQLAEAEGLFQQGRYAEALPLLDVVASDAASSRPEALRARHLMAYALHFLGSYPEARQEWLDLLDLDPAARPDPIEVPPEVVTFFTRIERRPTEVIVAAPPPAPAPPPTAPTVSVAAPSCAPVVCVLPFGVGQFAKGERVKGALFLGGEALLLAANVGLYWQRVGEYRRYGHLRDRAAGERSFVMQEVALGLFAATAIAGAVDALLD